MSRNSSSSNLENAEGVLSILSATLQMNFKTNFTVSLDNTSSCQFLTFGKIFLTDSLTSNATTGNLLRSCCFISGKEYLLTKYSTNSSMSTFTMY
jgi:hypothetical protein